MARSFVSVSIRFVLATAILLGVFSSLSGRAETPVALAPDQGMALWGQELLEMATSLRLMCVAAHPDDEDSETLAYYNRGFGVRTSVLLANWGGGGQNETGPELNEELGVIRSREMAEAAELLGTRIYCLNLKDFGYSKSVEETWKFWNHNEALERAVRILRQERPDIVITNHRVGSGHGHHQAMAQLIAEAIPLAASPEGYSSQVEEGLSPWKVERLFERRRHHEGVAEEPYDVGVPVWKIDAFRGVSFQEIAGEALLRHRSQGAKGGWEWVNRQRRLSPQDYYYLTVGDPPLGPFRDLFEELDGYWWGKEGWGPFTHEGLVSATPTLDDRRREGLEKSLEILRPNLESLEATLSEALSAVKSLPSQLDENPRWESVPPQDVQNSRVSWSREDEEAYQAQVIDRMRSLGREQRVLENMLGKIWGLEMEIQLEEERLCPGQQLEMELALFNRGTEPVEVSSYSLSLPKGWQSRARSLEIGKLGPMGTAVASYWVQVATGESPTVPETVELYRSSQPWQPNIRASALVEKSEMTGSVENEKRVEIVPLWEIWIEPEGILVPKQSHKDTVFLVQIRRHPETPAAGRVLVTLPDGVKREAGVAANQARRATIPVPWKCPDSTEPGTYAMSATLVTPSGTHEAQSKVVVAEVKVPEGLRVGVVQSYDTTLPDVLAMLGVERIPLDGFELKNGDLSGYDTILVDIRAYLEREDLREANHRLLSYASGGGHLVVFYHKSFDWNDALPPYSPYPIHLSHARVTDERSPVTLLKPSHPLFNQPNKIGPQDWEGWVQERGLYFPDAFDRRYERLVSMSDPGEEPLETGILWAEVGKGTYVYTSLVFYRQLRALVPGAFRLLANLVSYPKKRAGPKDLR